MFVGGSEAKADFDLAAWGERHLSNELVVFCWFACFALMTRYCALGDVNYFDDDMLYWYIGQKMHEGLVPYVDLWDRKPPGLFAIYYLIAGVSRQVAAFQLAGWVCVALTAQLVYRISRQFSGNLGALLAGTLYLALLLPFGGRGGQSPVFYNLPMALAAWLVISRREALRRGEMPVAIPIAMLCAGIAITIKQVAFFESVFFGLYVLYELRKSSLGFGRIAAIGALLALAGAAPMLLCAAIYLAIGHFHPFWVAMVSSNLAKTYNPGNDLLKRILILGGLQSPAWIFAIIAVIAPAGTRDRARLKFGIAWIVAALAGVFAIPNLHHHYVLPLMLPLAVMCSPFLQRGIAGPAFGLIYIYAILMGTSTFDFARAARSNAAMEAMVRGIEMRDPHPRLFVYDGPVYLYQLTGSKPASPLFFPQHLYFQPETNTSPLDTVSVVRGWLASWPSVIVIRTPSRGETRFQFNKLTLKLAEDYAHHDCRWQFRQPLLNMVFWQNFDVFGGCGDPAKSRKP